jgi:polysaccharide deacetylase 2 family uncharacterized protein YibQ
LLTFPSAAPFRPTFSRSYRSGPSASASFLLLALLLAMDSAGCHRANRQLSPSEIHTITREFALAASPPTQADSGVRTEVHVTYGSTGAVDHLDFTIHPAASGSVDPATQAQLLRGLGSVATRYHLTQDNPSESREGLLFTYRHAGISTHTIHIHVGLTTAREPAPPAKPEGPRLAIILDDLGGDRAAADAIFALSYPLTISILPDQPHSAEIAQEAHRRGLEVMLHLPMQSVGGGHPEARELRPGMPSKQVADLLNQFLLAVPGAVGVNNHQGSQSTADARLMAELMPALRDHHLFYIDSRTTAATVAFDAAQRSSVPAAFRNVPFLDDVEQVDAVRKQLHIALREAREKGDAVAIGHPHPATLTALRDVLPEAKSAGVRLVPASDLVR